MPEPSKKPGQVPLERALSKRGLASRTQARELIVAGRVRVNGVLRTQPLFPVNPDKAVIEIDGQRAAGGAGTRAFLFHKPRGAITTRSDEKGRQTVFDLLPVELRSLNLHAVGRLDGATTGLLILTNDTKLSAWLTDPSNDVPRIYLVSVRGEVSTEAVARLEAGIRDEGELLRASRVTLRKASGKESHLTVELRQGRNREIRRLFAALGHEVTRLKRVAYGGLELGNLEPGECLELSAEQLAKAFPRAPLRRTPSPDRG